MKSWLGQFRGVLLPSQDCDRCATEAFQYHLYSTYIYIYVGAGGSLVSSVSEHYSGCQVLWVAISGPWLLLHGRQHVDQISIKDFQYCNCRLYFMQWDWHLENFFSHKAIDVNEPQRIGQMSPDTNPVGGVWAQHFPSHEDFSFMHGEILGTRLPLVI